MSEFNNYHRVPRIEPYVPDRAELLGDETKQFSDADIGKPVKYSGETMVACVSGDNIVGFVTSVEPYSQGGHSVGAVKRDVNTEFLCTDEAGGLSVGDYVTAGTITALGTTGPAPGPNVLVDATPATAPAHKWQVVATYVTPSTAGDQVMVQKVG